MPDPTTDRLRGIIRRGKRRDRIFSYLGGGLILLSLGTLGWLIATLVRDGGPHLFHAQEVKADGHAPRFNDLSGTLERQGGDGGQSPTWLFKPDAFVVDASRMAAKLEVPSDQIGQKLAEVAGQRAVVEGFIADAGGAPYEVEKVTPLPPDGDKGKPGARIGRSELVGVIERKGTERKPWWELQLEPVVLDTADLQPGVDMGSLAGGRVALTPRKAFRREVGKLAVTDVAKLEKKPFLLSMPASAWYRAGILSAAVGTMLIMVVTMIVTLPLGVAAGIYLEEYAPKNRLTAIIEVNIANLAGVPSIIWGLLGLGLFVYLSQRIGLNFGRSIVTAGMTLGLLVLPIVIISTREAIRAIPGTIRDASIALGATKWQTVRHHVLPYSMGGILTGSIVALSRAIGETAPLIVVGAAVYLTFLPPSPIEYRAANQPPTVMTATGPTTLPAAGGPATAPAVAAATATPPPAPAGEKEWHVQPMATLRAPFTALPIQMFNWTARPEREFHRNAAAAGIVLIVMTLSLNSVAIWLRARLRKKIKW